MSLTHPDMEYPTTTRNWGQGSGTRPDKAKSAKTGKIRNGTINWACYLLSVGPHTPTPSRVHTFNTIPLKSVGPSKNVATGSPLCLIRLSINKVDPSLHTCDKKVDPPPLQGHVHNESLVVCIQWGRSHNHYALGHTWYICPPPPIPCHSLTARYLSHTRTHFFFLVEKHSLYCKNSNNNLKICTLPIHYYCLFQQGK